MQFHWSKRERWQRFGYVFEKQKPKQATAASGGGADESSKGRTRIGPSTDPREGASRAAADFGRDAQVIFSSQNSLAAFRTFFSTLFFA